MVTGSGDKKASMLKTREKRPERVRRETKERQERDVRRQAEENQMRSQ